MRRNVIGAVFPTVFCGYVSWVDGSNPILYRAYTYDGSSASVTLNQDNTVSLTFSGMAALSLSHDNCIVNITAANSYQNNTARNAHLFKLEPNRIIVEGNDDSDGNNTTPFFFEIKYIG